MGDGRNKYLQRNIITYTFAGMAINETNTYQQAKDVLNSLNLKQDTTIDIDSNNVKIFRKHLSELIKRQQLPYKFASRLLDNNQLMIIRIK